MLNFLFVEKKRKFRPSGLSACGLSACGPRSTLPHSQTHAKLKVTVKKNLTQGITDFKKFIDNDCYFVDKTRLIAHLINDPSEVHLITRPRRFGKTLNLSMIRYFFEALPPGGNSGVSGDAPTEEPPNASLFNDMSISKHPRCREYMGQYPVIHLSFKNVKKSNHEDCIGTYQGYAFRLNSVDINTCKTPACWMMVIKSILSGCCKEKVLIRTASNP